MNLTELKPERLVVNQERGEENLRIGDTIAAIVESYDSKNKKVVVRISEFVHGFIQLQKFTYPTVDVEKDGEDLALKSVRGHICKKITAKVIDVLDDRTVELDRSVLMEESMEILRNNIGSIVAATVEAVCSYGIFVDIGGGVRTLIRTSECSKVKYDSIKDFFGIGQLLPKVKILEFDHKTQFFKASIRQAYDEENLIVGSVEKLRICGNGNESLDGGYFVEYNPNTSAGIMDVGAYGMNLKNGEYVWAYIRKFKEKGFRASFISRV